MNKYTYPPPCPAGHEVEWPNALCWSCWSSGLIWFKGPPPQLPDFLAWLFFLLLGFFRIFFVTHLWMFFGTPKKVCYFGPRGLLDPCYTFSVPNLSPKNLPKSMFFGLQEVTYVGRRKNLKISFPPQRGAHFALPRESQNPPKIDGKSIPRAFYVKLVFWHLKNRLPGPPGTPNFLT